MDEWYSIGGFNDPMSSLSHLVGVVLFFVFAVLLLRSAWRDRLVFWFCLQFVVASLALLSISFVYHMQGIGTIARDVLLRLDVAAIFVLIASTFTVLHGILFEGWKRWGVILLQWAIAIVGLTLRAIFFHQIPKVLGDGIFLLMGWVGAYSAWLMWKKFGWPGVSKIILGGVFYTVGVGIHSVNSWVLIPAFYSCQNGCGCLDFRSILKVDSCFRFFLLLFGGLDFFFHLFFLNLVRLTLPARRFNSIAILLGVSWPYF